MPDPKSVPGTNAFGKQLRRIRLERGITQAELAKLVGYHSSMISRLESGVVLPKERRVILNLDRCLSAAGQLVAVYTQNVDDSFAPPVKALSLQTCPILPLSDVAHAFAMSMLRIRIWQTWLPDMQALLAGLGKAAANGAEIRIILIHPSSPSSHIRAGALGLEQSYPGLLLDKARAELRSMEISFDACVRFSDRMPTAQLYCADSYAWIGWYWPQGFSTHMPQVCAQEGSLLFDTFLDQFDREWTRLSAV